MFAPYIKHGVSRIRNSQHDFNKILDVNMSMSSLLDQIWHSSEMPMNVASQIAKHVPKSVVLEVGAHLWCAYYGLVPNSVTQSDSEIKFCHGFRQVSRLSESEIEKGTAFCIFKDLNLKLYSSFQLDGDFLQTNFSSILSALQIARDHSDGILFLPHEMREKRLNEIARTYLVERSILNALFSNFFIINSVFGR